MTQAISFADDNAAIQIAPRATLHLADIAAAMLEPGLRVPYFVLVQQGLAIEQRRYTRSARIGGQTLSDLGNPVDVARVMRAGATLVLHNIEHWHPDTAAEAVLLAEQTGMTPSCTGFVTPPREQGLPPHRDGVDVHVVQVLGTKEWLLYDVPTGDWTSGPIKDGRPHDRRIVLSPGDRLAVPAGLGHVCRTGRDWSFHLSWTLSPVDPAVGLAPVRALVAATHTDALAQLFREIGDGAVAN